MEGLSLFETSATSVVHLVHLFHYLGLLLHHTQYTPVGSAAILRYHDLVPVDASFVDTSRLPYSPSA